MTSGNFRMDAGEASIAASSFAQFWTAEQQQQSAITNEDRRVAIALLERGATECRNAAMKLRGKVVSQTIDVEAQDLEVGQTVVVVREGIETEKEITGLSLFRDRDKAFVTLDGTVSEAGLRDAFRVVVD